MEQLLLKSNVYSKFLAEKVAPFRERQIEIAMLKGNLKDYQKEGIQWLIMLFENGMNGILADEMGLGKTIQTIGFLAFLYEQEIKGPFLIVAPLSTLTNWINEFEKWAKPIRVLLYHGDNRNPKNIPKYNVIVTSYEVVMRDKRHFNKTKWRYLVVDEGHRLKNFNCKLIKELKVLSSENRLLLTGTPLQNNLGELWSLLNFILPDLFTNLEEFLNFFDDSDVNKSINDLHEILKPFLLRRLKSEVEVALPPKKEYVLYCGMSVLQHQLYQSINKTMALYKIDSLMNPSMQMRKVCNHPLLFEDESENLQFTGIVGDCGKMKVLAQLVPSLIKAGRRMLVFSQMTRMLDIIGEYFESCKYKYCRFDGTVGHEDRVEEIERFNADRKIKIFLLTTRAGGLGINLTSADTVIFYDSDWNPQMDLQAQDRVHRIGQSKPVLVFRLVTKNSIETKMLESASSKRHLEKLVIHKKRFKSINQYLEQNEHLLFDQQFEQNYETRQNEEPQIEDEIDFDLLTNFDINYQHSNVYIKL